MPTRTWDAESSYRFGFNTQERVDEISGKGNHNTALFWEYDTRLGRRWNLDPKPQLFISDYAVNGNNPIYSTDINGDDPLTGLIEAFTAFALTAGTDFMTNWIIEGQNYEQAFNNVS